MWLHCHCPRADVAKSDTQGHTNGNNSRHNSVTRGNTAPNTGKTRAFRHKIRLFGACFPVSATSTRRESPEPGMHAGRYVHIDRHRQAIQNTSPDSQATTKQSPRSSRAQPRSKLVRAVTQHEQQNAPFRRRRHPNLLVGTRRRQPARARHSRRRRHTDRHVSTGISHQPPPSCLVGSDCCPLLAEGPCTSAYGVAQQKPPRVPVQQRPTTCRRRQQCAVNAEHDV